MNRLIDALCAAVGVDFLGSLLTFSGTVTQGQFAEGWRVPFEYLWHSDHLLFAIELVGVAAAGYALVRRSAPPRLAIWMGGAVFTYVSLVVVSTLLEQFVVYGRLARQMTPFLCLLAAHLLTANLPVVARGRWVGGAGAAALAIQVAYRHQPVTNESFSPARGR